MVIWECVSNVSQIVAESHSEALFLVGWTNNDGVLEILNGIAVRQFDDESGGISWVSELKYLAEYLPHGELVACRLCISANKSPFDFVQKIIQNAKQKHIKNLDALVPRKAGYKNKVPVLGILSKFNSSFRHVDLDIESYYNKLALPFPALPTLSLWKLGVGELVSPVLVTMGWDSTGTVHRTTCTVVHARLGGGGGGGSGKWPACRWELKSFTRADTLSFIDIII